MKDERKVSLNKFTFPNDSESHIIRTVNIDGVVWFVAKDLLDALSLTNTTESTKSLDEDEKLYSVILNAGQKRNTLFVSESGMYALIFKSRKPIAKKFRKWVTSDVLPKIRKTGSYSSTPQLGKCLRRMVLNANRTDAGYFSVIQEMYNTIYIRLEAEGYIMPDATLDGTELRPDVSIGRGFANYLRDYYPSLKTHFKTYKHHFLNGVIVDARQYPDEHLVLFREYALNVWLPEKGMDYFKDRDPKALDYLPRLLSKKAS